MTHEHMSRPTGYEKREANIRITAVVALLSVVLMVIFFVNLNEMFVQVQEEVKSELVLTPVSENLLVLQAEEERVLHSYAIIDTAKQIYRIPIERAIELMAAEAKKGSAR